MLKGGLVLIWELDMNLGPTLIYNLFNNLGFKFHNHSCSSQKKLKKRNLLNKLP